MKICANFIFGFMAGIGILIVLALVVAGLHPNCEKCDYARHQISNIDSELHAYGKAHGAYPSDLKELSIILESESAVIDPWGIPYRYANFTIGDHTCFALWSFGSDGKPGGGALDELDIYSFSKMGTCITRL